MTTLQARAEASVWLARLKSEAVTAQDKRACEAWLAASAEHGQALAEATAAWEAAGALTTPPPTAAARKVRLSPGRREVVLAGCAGLAGLAVWSSNASKTYATQVGEVRRLSFEDGSSAVLDTNTRIVVHFRHGARHVQLSQGRVALTIVDDPLRPFTVGCRSLQILAVGRGFEVADRQDGACAIAVDGDLVVKPRAQPSVRLRPGERLIQTRAAPVVTDRPALDGETGWQIGRLDFRDATLSAAAREINRYNLRPIILDPGLGQLRVSGVYRAQDADAFANSVATLLGLQVVEAADKVRLKSAPARST